MLEKSKILLVEDDSDMRETCKQSLEEAGCTVIEASSPKESEPILLRETIDLIITDLKMPHGGGREVIRLAKSISPLIPIILITAYPSVNSAVDSFKSGVVDYLIKPFTNDQMMEAVVTSLKTIWAKDRSELLLGIKPQDSAMSEILGNSTAVKRMLSDIRRIAPMSGHVMVFGETGSGKELVSKAIHRFSLRAHRPMVNINCAALPETLLESELFGYEKGAFTDARTPHSGLLEQANGGILFLDEIADMSLMAQAKLLRVIEQKKCRRLGGSKIYDADVRIVAATHKNLKEEVAQKRFRDDLYYRISVLEINVPALRERKEDISLLAVNFLDKFIKENKTKTIDGFSDEALNMLPDYHWPGNIRELHNVLQKVFAVSNGPLITENDIIQSRALKISEENKFPCSSPMNEAILKFEKEFIEDALKNHNGNISKTALDLGIHRTSLQRLIKKLGINLPG